MTDDCDGVKARWVRVTAAMCEHEIFRREPYDRRSAWLWLIANAAWKDHRVRTRAGMIEIKRGEVIAGLQFLAETWGWSIKKVRTFLGELADEGMISRGQTRNQYAAIVTICNYEKYQTAPENGASETASEGQAKGKREASERQHSTKDTKDTIKKDDTRARLSSEATTSDLGTRREVAGLGKEEGEARVSLDNGRLTLANGLRAFWLDKFGGDAERLDLALTQVAAYVQPASMRPLETQVSAQLARIAAEKRDRDKRYERAAATGKQHGEPGRRGQVPAAAKPTIAIQPGTPEWEAWEAHYSRRPEASTLIEHCRRVGKMFVPSPFPPEAP